eukprot:s168_g10.t1
MDVARQRFMRQAQPVVLRTALCYASENGHVDVVRLLLEVGGVGELMDKCRRRALSYASAGGHFQVTQLLLEHMAAVDSMAQTGALIEAAKIGHVRLVQLLLGVGAATAKGYGHALISASDNGHFDVVRLLSEARAATDVIDRCGKTPLLRAATKGHTSIVKSLLEAGAAVDYTDGYGRSALIEAAEIGHVRLVQLLLRVGPAEDTTDDYGKTALIYASDNGHFDIVRLLSEARRCCSAALIEAAEIGHVRLVQLLLRAGAAVNYTHGHGKTALSSTSETGHADVVGLLLEARAAVDLMDRGGRTALMLASAKGHVDVVRHWRVCRGSKNQADAQRDADDSRRKVELGDLIRLASSLNTCSWTFRRQSVLRKGLRKRCALLQGLQGALAALSIEMSDSLEWLGLAIRHHIMRSALEGEPAHDQVDAERLKLYTPRVDDHSFCSSTEGPFCKMVQRPAAPVVADGALLDNVRITLLTTGPVPHLLVNCGKHRAQSCDACIQGRNSDSCHGDCTLYEGKCRRRQEVPGISCGLHRSASCADCPQGHGGEWCNGDCTWHEGQCVPLEDIQVNCGAHRAPSCFQCPRGRGPTWCNGECHWVNSTCESVATGCELQSNGVVIMTSYGNEYEVFGSNGHVPRGRDVDRGRSFEWSFLDDHLSEQALVAAQKKHEMAVAAGARTFRSDPVAMLQDPLYRAETQLAEMDDAGAGEKRYAVLARIYPILRNSDMHTIRRLRRMCEASDEEGVGVIGTHIFHGLLSWVCIRLTKEEARQLQTLFGCDFDGKPLDPGDAPEGERELLNYRRFFRLMGGTMRPFRLSAVKDAFKKLEDNAIAKMVDITHLQKLFCATAHPKVQDGSLSIEEAREEFFRQWELDHPEGRITWEAFQAYYDDVSLAVADDQIFVELVRSSWNL